MYLVQKSLLECRYVLLAVDFVVEECVINLNVLVWCRSQNLRVPIAPLENKKDYKICEKIYKQYEKDIKLVIKAEKKLQRLSQKRKSGRKSSSGVDSMMVSPVPETQPEKVDGTVQRKREHNMLYQTRTCAPVIDWFGATMWWPTFENPLIRCPHCYLGDKLC